jgi:vacuolar-type H+-ATPase subunit H
MAVQTIRNAEKEAKEIQDKAKIQAEKIKQETEEKLDEIYRTAYNEAIAIAEQRVLEMIEKAKKRADRDAQKLLVTAENQIKEIKEETQNKMLFAIDFVLEKITR